MFVAMFTFPVLSSLISNKLYVYDEPESLKSLNKDATKINKVEFSSNNISLNTNNVQCEMPWFSVIDLHFLLHKCYCKRRKWYKDYDNELQNVNADLGRNLDIVNFMRRLTSYSYAFKFLLDKTLVTIISERSNKITLLKKGTIEKLPNHFGKFGHYGMQDLWLISIYRMYMDMSAKKVGVQKLPEQFKPRAYANRNSALDDRAKSRATANASAIGMIQTVE